MAEGRLTATAVMSGVLSPAQLDIFRRPQPPLPPSTWDFTSLPLGHDDLVAVGADLQIGTLVQAYAHGLFPMPLDDSTIGWFSPVRRGIIPLDDFHVSQSLRKSCRRYRIAVDTCFTEVVRACGDPRRPHGWINEDFIEAYTRLHRAGWAHSVEVFANDTLVGGVYGVHVHGLFAGESMFHTRTDASKVALVALVALLRAAGVTVFDVQWSTPHLVSLGAIEVPREEYLRLVDRTQKHPSSRQTAVHG
ncbi:MAG: leucyl/phenylalanyl-tRNA--protein transferase [Ilumatobacteraceae bacterium]